MIKNDHRQFEILKQKDLFLQLGSDYCFKCREPNGCLLYNNFVTTERIYRWFMISAYQIKYSTFHVEHDRIRR